MDPSRVGKVLFEMDGLLAPGKRQRWGNARASAAANHAAAASRAGARSVAVGHDLEIGLPRMRKFLTNSSAEGRREPSNEQRDGRRTGRGVGGGSGDRRAGASALALCPLCSMHFHRRLIAAHAAGCAGVPAPTPPASNPSAPLAAAASHPEPPAAMALRSPDLLLPPPNPLGPLRHSRSHDRPGGRQGRRSLERAEFDYLVVLDFEWTCDNTRPVLPTQTATVLLAAGG